MISFPTSVFRLALWGFLLVFVLLGTSMGQGVMSAGMDPSSVENYDAMSENDTMETMGSVALCAKMSVCKMHSSGSCLSLATRLADQKLAHAVSGRETFSISSPTVANTAVTKALFRPPIV